MNHRNKLRPARTGNPARRRVLPVFLCLLAAAFLVMIIGCGIYVTDYYHADETALAALESSETVNVEVSEDRVVFVPKGGAENGGDSDASDSDAPDSDSASVTSSASSPTVGFIFYPGGKVEHTAYAPLLHELASNGVLCVLLEMPLRLAVLDMDAAEGIPEAISTQYPSVERWYIGGHSLGGSMAASYAAGHAADAKKVDAAADSGADASGGNDDAAGFYRGLVLLASYSTADLTDTGLEVVSLYGTNDQVLNLEKYEEYHSNLPADTVEIVLEGGNHAQFGSYGPQDGDGTASISSAKQTTDTAAFLLEFFR